MTPMQQAALELMQRSLALTARIGATRILTVSLPAPIAAVAGTTAQATPLNFQEEGIIIGMSGQEQTATAAKYAKTELRLQIGAEDVISDGQGGSFAPFMLLFPPGQPYFSLLRKVQVGVPWTFTFRNQDAAATAIPTVTLSFIADADLRRFQR